MSPSGPGAPPKPQRSFSSLLGNSNNNNSSNSQQQHKNPPVTLPQQQQQQSQQLYMRPLPDRPYSVAGQYSVMGVIQQPSQASVVQSDRRSFPVEGYTGYLSSPERRLPNGQIVRSLYAVQPQPVVYEDGVYGSRPSSVVGVIDDAARVKMENMERQLANLTGLVQAALIQPNDSKGKKLSILLFFQLLQLT